MLEFYHCTSDIFLDSIKKNGLGKINPNFDLNLLELLSYVYRVANENLPNNESLKSLDFTTQLMINQEIRKVDKEIYNVDILNFKHDGLFLSLGDLAAITHSHYNKYGSEILNRIMQIIKVLDDNGIDFRIPPTIDKLNILSLISKIPKPIFIKIKNLDYNFLFNDRDIPMGIMMTKIENELKTTSEKVLFHFKQTTVFKYIKTVDQENFEAFYLEYDGHPTDRDFVYYLSSVK
jgi:hypothetical protein